MIKAQRLGVLLERKEGYAKFNAGMIKEGEVIHILYRFAKTDKVEGKLRYIEDYISYAQMNQSGELLYDSDECPLIKFDALEDGTPQFTQDPRIVKFEEEYILFYTVWDEEIARVGMSRTKDFKAIEHIGIIPTKVWDKDAFIFPERINGKIVYIHRIEPDIQIDYFDSFEEMLAQEYWDKYEEKIHDKVVIKGEYDWENLKVGGSIPPIKTELGWLFIYHGVANDRDPFCYRAGVAVLDKDDPSKVIARLKYPILEPVESYERVGDVNEVVFPQGAYIDGDYLYMSYGAADSVVALCRFNYKELIGELEAQLVERV